MSREDQWIRISALSAIALVVLYITVTIVGASLRPGYSHVRDSVSELIEVGAPNKALLDTLMGTYHLLLISFAYGLHFALPRTKRGWIGPALVGVVGILGIILTLFFPCDIGCEANPTTMAGRGHGVLVAISALLVLAAMVALFWRTRAHTFWRGYSRYTLISALLTLCFGLASLPLLNTDYVGLAERIGLIPIFAWFIMSGVQLWNSTAENWKAT
jgi:hypothetical protein